MRGLLIFFFVMTAACAQKPVVQAPPIDPNWENEVAAEHNRDVLACYEAGRKKSPKVAGELVMNFRVSPAGEIADVRVMQPVDPVFDACVVKAAAAWKFPWHAQRKTSETLYMINSFKVTRDSNGVGHSAFKEESSLDPDAVKVAVKMYDRETRACYERALKRNSKLNGKLILSWTLDSSGKASAIVVKKPLEDKLDTCIIESMKSWKFPQTSVNKTAVVSYPFFFSTNQ